MAIAVAATLAVSSWMHKPAVAPPPDIEIPSAITAPVARPVKIPAKTQGTLVKWIVASPDKAEEPFREERASGKELLAFFYTPGTYRVYAYTSLQSGPTDASLCVVSVGSVPIPPGPGPGPGPTPPPPVPPKPGENLRVLVVYESSQLSTLKPEQLDIFYNRSLRDYLNKKAALGRDGKTREYRFYDKDVSTDNEAQFWKDSMKKPRSTLPWILVSTSGDSFEGPLPQNVADTLALIKKYGGE